MKTCDPNDALPVTCAEAFRGLGEAQARANEKLDRIDERTARTSGHVERLFDRTAAQQTRLELLRAEVDSVRGGNATWARRLWQLIVGLALLGAGYFLKS